jgi:hypothetical protein
MRAAVTISYNLEDIPADVVEVSVRLGVPVMVRTAWDHGCYRLRLQAFPDDVDWPDDTDYENSSDYLILLDQQFDGGWNWDSLSADEEVAKELLFQYAEHQRLLYPGLKVVIDEDEEE